MRITRKFLRYNSRVSRIYIKDVPIISWGHPTRGIRRLQIEARASTHRSKNLRG